MKKIYFIGFGLIGASIAKSLKSKKKGEYDITVYDYHTEISETYRRAVSDGNVDRVSREFNDLFKADIVILCAPTLTNLKYLKNIADAARETGSSIPLITDVSSVKGNIVDEAKKLGLSSRFIGGHPMAGSEKTGYDNATDHLLENAYYILTPTDESSNEDIETLKEMILGTGAIFIVLDPKKHDRVTSAISHVPHLVAVNLVNLVQDAGDDTEMTKLLAAGGFKDITRIASSSPAMWESICSSNKDAIEATLDTYIKTLEKIKTAVVDDDNSYIYDSFERAGAFRSSIPNSRGAFAKSHFFYVDIEDRAGAIAKVATTLFTHGISIKNIGIIHNREYEKGVLRVEFYEADSLLTAVGVLKADNYTVHRVDD